MPEFTVFAPIKGTKFIGKYDAPDAEAAIAMAEADPDADTSVTVCHQCSEKVDELGLSEYFAEGDGPAPKTEVPMTAAAALRTLLDQIDYLSGNCRANEMIGALVDESLLRMCRDAAAGE